MRPPLPRAFIDFLFFTVLIVFGFHIVNLVSQGTPPSQRLEKDVLPSNFGIMIDKSERSIARALVLIHGAREQLNFIPFVLFIPLGVDEEKLLLTEDKRRVLQYYNTTIKYFDKTPTPPSMSTLQEKYKFAWNKVGLLKEIDYKRLVIVDLDMQFLKSSEELLNVPGFAAASGSCFPCKIFEVEINGGLIVIDPSVELYERITNFANSQNSFTFGYAEQDLWWFYYKKQQKERWINLSNLYNMSVRSCHCTAGNQDRDWKYVHIAHWVCTGLDNPTDVKPWDNIYRNAQHYNEPSNTAQCYSTMGGLWHKYHKLIVDQHGKWLDQAVT